MVHVYPFVNNLNFSPQIKGNQEKIFILKSYKNHVLLGFKAFIEDMAF